jgi:two-component system sensor histidine kinase CpxA
MRLSSKVGLLLLANVGGLALLLLALAAGSRQDFSSLLLAPARERLFAVAQQLALDLESTEPAQRDALLRRYETAQRVDLALLGNDGARLDGRTGAIPPEVLARLRAPAGLRPDPPPPGAHAPLPAAPPFLVSVGGRHFVGVRLPVSAPGGDRVAGTLLFSSPDFWTNPFFFPLRPWLAGAGLALGVSLLCWLPFLRGLTGSVARMTQATARIAEGRFDVRLVEPRSDELGELARSISAMTARLESLVSGQKRFLGEVAHELRSPLGRLQVAISILERRLPEEQARLLDLREDVELMAALTDELLELAQAEAGARQPWLGPVSLAEVVARAVRLEAREVEVRVEVPGRLLARGDPELLFRALANLLRNAVRHAGPAGPIEVTGARRGERVELSVADSGPGLAEASLARVFEPFHRPDDARDRRTGGAGLGLAIVRACVEACGGSVVCRNRQPRGLEVVISLPAGA